MNRINKFDRQSIHFAKLSLLTGVIKISPNQKYLTTYIIYLVQMAVSQSWIKDKGYLYVHQTSMPL